MSELKTNKISPFEGTVLTLGDSGDNIALASGATATGFGSTDASDLTSGTLPDARFPATLPAISGASLTGLPTPPSRGTIGGLRITNDGTDAAHDIGIAVGFARDYTDAATMSLTGALIKKIDATWAVGTNAGGLDSTDTVAANTGYGVYLIRRSDTGVVDVLMSSDMTSAGSALTMPTNYDQKRLIGWVRSDASSNISSFIHSGDYFQLLTIPGTEITDNTITNGTYETATLTIPPLTIAYGTPAVANASGTQDYINFFLKTKGSNEGTADSSDTFLSIQGVGDVDFTGVTGNVFVNSASQVEYACNEPNGTATFYYTLKGCHMLTRSNP